MRTVHCIDLCVQPLQLRLKEEKKSYAISAFDLKALACFGKWSDMVEQMDQVKKKSRNDSWKLPTLHPPFQTYI